MKNWILCIILIGTIVSCFSQAGFPKKISLDGVDCVAISYEQLTVANEEHVKAVRLEQISDSLQVLSNECDSMYQQGRLLVEGLRGEINTQKEIAGNERKIAAINYDLWKGEEKKNKKLRTWMGIGGAGAGAVIIALVVGFLVK